MRISPAFLRIFESGRVAVFRLGFFGAKTRIAPGVESGVTDQLAQYAPSWGAAVPGTRFREGAECVL
jgi:hypothetical protein